MLDIYCLSSLTIILSQIIVHSSLGALVVVIACILSAGYALTCRNMYLVVEKEIRCDHNKIVGKYFNIIYTIRARVEANPNPNRQYSQQNIHENFASDHLVNTYLNNQRNVFGQNR